MDVLLVNPPFNRTFGLSGDCPLGVQYLKAWLVERDGLKAEVCNLDFKPQGEALPESHRAELARGDFSGLKSRLADENQPVWREWRRLLESSRPRIVGMTMTTPQHDASVVAARMAKSVLPEAVVVTGGIHPSSLPEETLETGAFDYLIAGEAERAFSHFCRAVLNGESPDGVPGLWRKGARPGECVPEGPFLEDLDSLPFPGQTWIDGSGKERRPGVSVSLIASRGCPFGCTFCARNVIWKRRVRNRSAANVVAELRSLIRRFGVETVYFKDDTFNLDSRRVAELCEAFRRARLRINWSCTARPELLAREQIRDMKSAGCFMVCVGAESGDTDVLKGIDKVMEIEKTKQAVRWVHEEGLDVRAWYMLGYPDETREAAARTVALVKELDAIETLAGFLVPFPGTEIHAAAEREGRLATRDWFQYHAFNPGLIRREHYSNEWLLERHREIGRWARGRVPARRRRQALSAAFCLRKIRAVKRPRRLLALGLRLLQTAGRSLSASPPDSAG